MTCQAAGRWWLRCTSRADGRLLARDGQVICRNNRRVWVAG
jgi:hypothetical protein